MNMRPEPTAFLSTLRQRVEHAIEALLLLLDTIDGDPDLEPSLGAPEAALPDCLRYVGDTFTSTSQQYWSDGLGDLEEEEQHDAEDDLAEAGHADAMGAAT